MAVEPGGERVFYHTPGVTELLDADAFRRCLPVLRQCKWVQVGYFGLLPAHARSARVLAELRGRRPRRSR